LQLGKRNALMRSRNVCIQELWRDSNKFNIPSDSLLCRSQFKSALKEQKDLQIKKASDHFLGLKSQGAIAKSILESIPSGQIKQWNSSIEQLPGYIYNFTRKAVQSQLPTCLNLFRWRRAPSNACPKCGQIQSNKHVLSNCSSPEVLERYTGRHNTILSLLIEWMRPKLNQNVQIFCDLQLSGTKNVCDLFKNSKPDLALKTSNKVGLLELTVCHETNLIVSRNYKLNKYRKIADDRAVIIEQASISLSMCEVSTLGFTVLDPKFLSDWGLPLLDKTLLNAITKYAIMLSFSIYCDRNL